MLSAVILEDEVLASERLRILLENCNITLLNVFHHAQHALNWFEHHHADIVFVDIGLPEITGLQFVERLKRLSDKIPYIIFTTAYDEYALQAFDLAASDYLLKPIKQARLQEAISRIKILINPEDQGDLFFCINTRDKKFKIPYQKVAYLMAEQKLVWLYTTDGQSYELPKTLLYWEDILQEKVIRVHRNTLVMAHALDSLVLIKQDNMNSDNNQWGAKLIDIEVTLPISRRQLSILRQQYQIKN